MKRREQKSATAKATGIAMKRAARRTRQVQIRLDPEIHVRFRTFCEAAGLTMPAVAAKLVFDLVTTGRRA